MAQPRVSVVMIFLNGEQFLAEAVESVLAQTRTDWELLLVDDGSSDGSEAIARGYEARDPARIRYLSGAGQSSRGTGPARQRGLLHAAGEFIAFLDADDVWLPEKLERHVALLDAHPAAAMVYGPTLLWYDWGPKALNEGVRDQLRPLGVEVDCVHAPPALIPRYLRGQALPPSTCGLLVRRDAALRAGGFEGTFSGMYEDHAFIYRMCLTEHVLVTGTCLDWYRQHPGSMSVAAEALGTYNSEGPSRAHEAFLRWFQREAEGRGYLEPQIDAALRAALLPYTSPRLAWVLARVRGARARVMRSVVRSPLLRRLRDSALTGWSPAAKIRE